jgi:hypothetical protein
VTQKLHSPEEPLLVDPAGMQSVFMRELDIFQKVDALLRHRTKETLILDAYFPVTGEFEK